MLMDPATFADNKSLQTFVERPIVDVSWRADPLSRQIISEIQMECVGGFPRGPMFLEHAANVFVSQLAHILTSLQNSRREGAGALDDVRLLRVLDFLQDNFHRNITLSELANLVGFTPRYFCAAFKETTGQSPHQFQIEQRIERAKIMLRDSKLSIADVAYAVGFCSQSHLYGFFTRATGVTPMRYRQEVSSVPRLRRISPAAAVKVVTSQ